MLRHSPWGNASAIWSANGRAKAAWRPSGRPGRDCWAQLAPHCRPLALRGNTLVVGASQPQWLQALRYSRHQLLAVLRSRGYAVGQLQFQQHDAAQASEPFSAELDRSWSEHPCRITGLDRLPPLRSPEPERGNRALGLLRPLPAPTKQLEAEMAADQPGG